MPAVLAAPVVAQTFIYGKLSADSALAALVGTRIFSEYVKGTTFPAVVFKQMDPGHDAIPNGTRILSQPLYIVEAVGKTSSYVDIGPIADRIDALLEGAHGAAAGGFVSDCYRERAYQMAELQGADDYRHLGGYYRLTLGPG